MFYFLVMPLRKIRKIAPLLLIPTIASADLTLENEPLFLSNSVAPNLVISFDVGENMVRGFFPDSISGFSAAPEAKSFDYNPMAYNPNHTYLPGRDSSGALLPNAIFTAAKLPVSTTSSGNTYTVDAYNTDVPTTNLSTQFRFPWDLFSTDSVPEFAADAEDDAITNAQPAYYYSRNTATAICNEPNGFHLPSCYNKITVTQPEDQQNFANWYQYHSLRYLKGKTLLTQALHNLPDETRVAWQTTRSDFIASANRKYVRSLSRPAIKSALYSWLSNLKPYAGSTSTLKTSMIRAGDFFSNDANNNAYEYKPGGLLPRDNKELACRSNYHLLVSSGNHDNEAIAIGNSDQTGGELPDGKHFEPNTAFQYIYPGAYENTLADIAFHYWRTDLRDDLENSVPYFLSGSEALLSSISQEGYWNPLYDVATWQHMNNFVLGFGAGNSASPAPFNPLDATSYNNLLTGNADWVSHLSGTPEEKIDDLWHAVINSRGRYFSIFSPSDLASSLSSLPTVLEYRESSAASLSATSGSINRGSALIQVGFNTRDWSGFVKRYPLSTGHGDDDDPCHSQPTGTLCALSTEVKPSSVSNWNTKDIFTINPNETTVGQKGIALKTGAASHWNDLTAAQRADIINTDRLDYILGDTTNETNNGGTLRDRSSAQHTLAAVVHSPPQIVGNGRSSDGAYKRLYPASVSPSGKSHFNYLASISAREEMLYVAANDGMLHAYLFESNPSGSESLTEQFSYIPDAVFPDLAHYSHPDYSYRGLIDGDLATGDAFFNNDWHTVLVGAYRQGAKGLFALDITDPGNFSASDVLWEVSDRSHRSDDLGHIYGKVNIVKTQATFAGQTQAWGAVIGNGYNSVNGNAVLLVVDIKSGNTIATVDTGIGLNESNSAPSQANRVANLSNGLAAPFVVDIDQDFIVDYAYAGDLYGNFWRFNLQGNNPESWSADLLFKAGTDQPITAQPVVSRNPGNRQVMIYLGTGKYLEPDDDLLTDNDPLQSAYAFVERFESNPAVITPAHLLSQTILSEQYSGFGTRIRLTSQNPISYYEGTGLPGNVSESGYLGWKMNLSQGERILYQPISRAGIIAIASTKPAIDACDSGGSSWLMTLDAYSGGRLNFQAFDSNNDGIVNNSDTITYNGENIFVSGSQDTFLGIASPPSFLHDRRTNTDYVAINGSSGKLGIIQLQGNNQKVGILAWRRLR